MKKKTESPTIQFLRVLWQNRQSETGHSWRKLNDAMHRAIMIAVAAGLHFDTGDIAIINTEFRSGYWMGEGGWEKFYTLAVAAGNASAWKCFEDRLPRVPFIWPWATYDTTLIPRLVVGAEFEWEGKRVKVTSINTDNVIACAYTWTKGTYPKQKLKKRYRITREMFAAERKARKKACAAKTADPAE